jgi:hypothetical protein
VVLEPGSLIMERKMLTGIRDRAESWGAEGPVGDVRRPLRAVISAPLD